MQGRCTNSGDKVETGQAANPVKSGDDGDWVLGESENFSGEVRHLVSGVLGGHDGEEWETGGMEVGGDVRFYMEVGRAGPG